MYRKKIKTKLLAFFLLLFIIFLFTNNKVLAHPGNTASDGCHYCRTNCDRWGVAWNARHCHGGAVAPVQQTQKVIYPTSTSIPIQATDTPTPTNAPIPTLTSAEKPTAMTTPTQTPKQSFWRQLVRFLFKI